MKSFCTSALVLLVSLAWMAPPAAAQGDPYDSATPLPVVTPMGVIPASYDLPSGRMSPYGSMFVGREQDPAPQAGSESVIDGADGHSEFAQAVQSDWTDCEGSRGSCGHWFGAVGGLVMGRNRPNLFATTFDSGSGANVMNTQDAGANWTGGWQVTAGYMMGGCCGSGPGFGFTYWGLGSMTGFAQRNSGTDSLSTTIDTTGVNIGANPASDYFVDSASQRVSRDDSAENFEANMYFGVWNFNRWTVTPFAGFRYFRFNERLSYGGLAGGAAWGGNGGADEAYLSFGTTNNLFGGQVGTYANYWVTDRFGLFFGPKVGLFGNQMIGRTRLYSGDGINAYNISSHKSDFSVMGEVDTGFNYFLRPSLFVYMGYRVVGIANIALADEQFLPNLSDTQGFGQVKQNGDLILHGVMMGAGWMF
jgi:hypothetical protein